MMLLQVTIVATGLQKPNLLPNLEHTLNYQTIPNPGADTREAFTNKTSLIYGLGNAAFETGNAIMPHGATTILFPGRKAPPDHDNFMLGFEMRYPGGVRAQNAEMFDAYALKSLDGGFGQSQFAGWAGDRVKIFRCGEGKRQRCVVTLEKGKYVTSHVLEPRDPKAAKFYDSVKKYWAEAVPNHVDYRLQRATDYWSGMDLVGVHGTVGTEVRLHSQ